MIRLAARRCFPARLRVLAPLGGLLLVTACAVPAAPVTLTVATPKPSPVVVLAPPVPAPTAAPASLPETVATAPATVGKASWYRVGRGLHRTCSGAMLNNDALTAASPTLPMGTKVRVARLDGGASVLLTVNDRMPRGHRILDVTVAAARELGLMGSGVATVSVTPVSVTPLSATPLMLADNQ